MRRLTETRALGVFLPPPPHDFVGRAEALEMLYAALVEKQDKTLLYGEPGLRKIHARAQVCLANAGCVRRGSLSTLRPACRRQAFQISEIPGGWARWLELMLWITYGWVFRRSGE